MGSIINLRNSAIAALALGLAAGAAAPASAQSRAVCDREARAYADDVADRGGAAWRRAHDRAFADCMRSERARGSAAPEPGTRDWYDYCSDKYRSFNPDTGFYKGYDGDYHLCK